ncbi:MAG: EamA family transporter [Thermoplasmata archaeon]|nr:EamA family transporter [Thermoplasmata archaeon]
MALVLAWGFNYLVVRVGLTASPPLWLATYRAGVGALGVVAYLLVRRAPTRLDPRGRRDAFLLGLPNTAAFFGLWFVAATYLLPGETAVVVYTFPLWVAILAGPLLGERLRPLGGAALAGGFTGVFLIARAWTLDLSTPTALPLLALLGGSISWALGTVLIQRRFGAATMIEVNAFQLLGGTSALAVAAAIFEGVPTTTAPMTLVPVALYLGLVGTAFAYGVWFTMLGRTPAGVLSRYVFLVPVVALGASTLLLGERLDAVQLVGVGLVVIAVYLTNRTRASEPMRPSASVPLALE